MTTLRVRLEGPVAADVACEWATFDARGALNAEGRDVPARWPPADRREAVLAAALVRVTSVVLPPIAGERVAAAARYAIEDDLAGSIDEERIATSAQARDGRVRIVVVAKDLIAGLEMRAVPTFARIIAEPELAAPAAHWRWCAPDRTHGGFVRASDGSAFAVEAIAEGRLPRPLAHALAQATRTGSAPTAVDTELAASAAELDGFARESGVAFRSGAPWRWQRAPAALFAAALELRSEPAPVSPRESRAQWRIFRPALALLGLALAIQIAATLAEWTWLRVASWRQSRAWIEVAAAAGVADADAATPGQARAALARRHAEVRHARGQSAPGDALPLLARAAPALASLPPGAIKSAIYADGHWVLESPAGAPASLREAETRLRAAGVPALFATSATGTRLRFGLD